MPSFTNSNFSKTVEEGRIEVTRILKTNQGDHVGVLGIKDKSEYRSDDEFKNAVLEAFVRAGMLTNPAYNKTEDSYNAFKLVKKAAKNLGVSSEDIEAVEEWEDEPDEKVTLRNGHWVPKDNTDMTEALPTEDSPQHKSPEDEAFYKSMYEKATPYLNRFIRNTKDSEAVSKIQEFNKEIFAYNQQKGLKGLEGMNGSIKYPTIGANVQSIEHWRQVFLGNSANILARQKFEAFMEILKIVNTQEGYPSTWLPDSLPATAPETRTDQITMASRIPQAISFDITAKGLQDAQEFFHREKSSQPFTITFNSTSDDSLKKLWGNMDDMLTAFATSSTRVQTIKYSQPPGRDCKFDLAVFSGLLSQCLTNSEFRSIEIHVENVDQQQLFHVSDPAFLKRIRVIKLLLPYRLTRFWSLPFAIKDVLSKASNLQQLLIKTERKLWLEEDEIINQIRQRGVEVEVKWASGRPYRL